MTNSPDRTSLLLSVNRALWGEVSANMRRITAKSDDMTIWLRFYFDGEPSDTDRNSVDCIGAEVIADFPEQRRIEEEIVRLDTPDLISDQADWLTVYARRERT